jgi:hypothetical protein
LSSPIRLFTINNWFALQKLSNIFPYLFLVLSLENECEFVLWVKIDGKVFNLEQPVIFGTIYIPPEYTRYSSDEAFNQIEHELHSFPTNSKYVCLIGDFNSRTGEDDDYVNVNFEHGATNTFVITNTTIYNKQLVCFTKIKQHIFIFIFSFINILRFSGMFRFSKIPA